MAREDALTPQPISTAPTDGTEIITFIATLRESKPIFARWYKCRKGLRKGMEYWALRGTSTPTYPTHWTPMPSIKNQSGET